MRLRSLFFELSLLLLLCLGVTSTVLAEKLQPFDLTPILSPSSFWSLDKETVAKLLKGGPFRWVSVDKKEIRGSEAPIIYNGIGVLEVVFRFKDEKPKEIYLSLYNRGDSGNESDATFMALMRKVDQLVTTLSNASGEDLEETPSSTRIRNHSKIWMGPDGSFRLDTGYSKITDTDTDHSIERPEFINLTLLPGDLAREDLVVQREVDPASINLTDRIQHTESGDVLLTGIPMVDQGQKGYCAVATMERILRYYGCEVNEHELAQQANSGQEGTSQESLIKAIRAMGTMMGLHLHEYQKPSDFYETIEEYNQIASRKGNNTLDLAGATNVNDVYRQMRLDILKAVRLKDSNKVDRFFSNVSEAIDQGFPLAWGVTLGWVKEIPDLKGHFGGHMRLIIGYNPDPDKREILYSDSWGYGHELKRMSLDDAYTITEGLYVVEPK